MRVWNTIARCVASRPLFTWMSGSLSIRARTTRHAGGPAGPTQTPSTMKPRSTSSAPGIHQLRRVGPAADVPAVDTSADLLSHLVDGAGDGAEVVDDARAPPRRDVVVERHDTSVL